MIIMHMNTLTALIQKVLALNLDRGNITVQEPVLEILVWVLIFLGGVMEATGGT